jgi:hypothetical protein
LYETEGAKYIYLIYILQLAEGNFGKGFIDEGAGVIYEYIEVRDDALETVGEIISGIIPGKVKRECMDGGTGVVFGDGGGKAAEFGDVAGGGNNRMSLLCQLSNKLCAYASAGSGNEYVHGIYRMFRSNEVKITAHRVVN